MTLREAAEKLLEYEKTGAPDFPDWDKHFEALRAALAEEASGEELRLLRHLEKVVRAHDKSYPSYMLRRECLTPLDEYHARLDAQRGGTVDTSKESP